MSAVAQTRPADEFAATTTSTSRTRSGCRPSARTSGSSGGAASSLFELARTNLRAQHYNTTLGQLWLILNPLLLGLVYFSLVDIIRGGGRGSRVPRPPDAQPLRLPARQHVGLARSPSVVGRREAHPQHGLPAALLPLESVLTSFMRFLPTLAVYAVMHVAVGLPVRPAAALGDPDHRAHRGLRRRRGDARRHVAGLLPRPDELPPVLHADLAVRLADPLLRRRGAREASGRFSTATRCTRCWPRSATPSSRARMPPAGLLAAGLAWAVAASWSAHSSSSPGSVSLRPPLRTRRRRSSRRPTPSTVGGQGREPLRHLPNAVEKKPTLKQTLIRLGRRQADGPRDPGRARTSPSRSRTAPRSGSSASTAPASRR